MKQQSMQTGLAIIAGAAASASRRSTISGAGSIGQISFSTGRSGARS